MTASLTALRCWRSAPVGGLARSVTAAADALRDVVYVVLAAPGASGGGWQGPAAEQAAAGETQLADAARAASEELTALGVALAAAADEVSVVEGLVRGAEALASEHGLSLTDEGTARAWDAIAATVVDPVAVQAAVVARQRVVQAVETMVARAQVCAEEVDRALAAAFEARLPRALAWIPVPGISPVPPSGATAPQVAAWWAGLSTTQREQLIVERPDWVGAADGLPAWARDRANRLRLDGLERPLVEELAEIDSDGGADPFLGGVGVVLSTGAAGLFRRDRLWARRQDVGARLESVRAVRAVLDQSDGVTRQLLLLDTSGQLATAAVTTGDIDRAGHVAVYVCGLSTTVDGSLRDENQKASRLAALSTRQSRAYGDGREVAVVTWLGYQAPQWQDTFDRRRSVAAFGGARTAAPALRSFLTGVDVSRRADPPHLTLVGHSYGSVVSGVALAETPRQLPVDDLVVFGSPGLDVQGVAGLGLAPGRVHVLETVDDPVADMARFGTDPDTLVGADVLATTVQPLPDGRVGAESAWHSEYLDDGTTSQWNVAAVVAGTREQTVKGDGGTIPSVVLIRGVVTAGDLIVSR